MYSGSFDALRAYIGTLLPQAADADEVLQQTSLTLWKKFDDFRPDGNFTSWGFGIAINLVRNYRRVESRCPVFLVADDVLELLGQTRQSSADMLEDRREALDGCMQKLAAADRTLLDRCYARAANIAKIAAELGRTPNALYKRLKILRRQLFDCINLALGNEEDSS